MQPDHREPDRLSVRAAPEHAAPLSRRAAALPLELNDRQVEGACEVETLERNEGPEQPSAEPFTCRTHYGAQIQHLSEHCAREHMEDHAVVQGLEPPQRE